MTSTPLTEQQLDEIEAVASRAADDAFHVSDCEGSLQVWRESALKHIVRNDQGEIIGWSVPAVYRTTDLVAEVFLDSWDPGEDADDDQQRQDVRDLVDSRAALPALLAEVRRLRDELAETKALNDPRLRGILVKAAPDKDLYVQWSTVCDMPGGVFSRETALEYGFPRSKVDHADEHGSSSRIGDGTWDDKGWVAEQRGWLRRDLIGDYAVEYLHGDREAAYALLEPFDDEPAAVPAVAETGE